MVGAVFGIANVLKKSQKLMILLKPIAGDFIVGGRGSELNSRAGDEGRQKGEVD